MTVLDQRFIVFLTGSGSLGSGAPFFPGNSVFRSESTQVVLVSDCRGFGISLNSDDVTASDNSKRQVPFISCIEPKSVAERWASDCVSLNND